MTKDIGILFMGHMVRAILEGRKTQTRRELYTRIKRNIGSARMDQRYPPPAFTATPPDFEGANIAVGEVWDLSQWYHAEPGMCIWVRETFFAWGHWEKRFSEKKGREEWHFVDDTLYIGRQYRYAADGAPAGYKKGKRTDPENRWWKRPAIHMPRTASRLTLQITGKRIERLHSITIPDALAEGVQGLERVLAGGNPPDSGLEAGMILDPRFAYQMLWQAINGTVSWESNPYVVAIDFKVIKGEGNARTV